jgi:hypothetical protein
MLGQTHGFNRPINGTGMFAKGMNGNRLIHPLEAVDVQEYVCCNELSRREVHGPL